MDFKSKNAALLIILLYQLSSCKKFVEIDQPINQYPAATVFESVSTAVAAMNGIYTFMSHDGLTNYTGRAGISIRAGMLADEVNGYFSAEYLNSESVENLEIIEIWNSSYRKIIYQVNSLIEGLEASNSIPSRSKEILLAEAKFIRAFSYFYLTNLFGEVPLVLSTDFKKNSNIERSSVAKVYEQILSDLKYANDKLPSYYFGPDLVSEVKERVRPNKSAAAAMLSRVYLYLGDWQNAETFATSVLENEQEYALLLLDSVFLANSKEAVWQLQPTALTNGTNNPDAQAFINPFGFAPLAELSSFLFEAFEANDLRKSSWVKDITDEGGSHYIIPFKYKVGIGDRNQEQAEYIMVIRLAELFLIRAEAQAHLGSLDGALADLNRLRARAGLSKAVLSEQKAILDAISQERYVEMFTEWGHRWFDLKRTGALDSRMNQVAPSKGGQWQPYKSLMPIPVSEFRFNPALIGHQNPGYPESL